MAQNNSIKQRSKGKQTRTAIKKPVSAGKKIAQYGVTKPETRNYPAYKGSGAYNKGKGVFVPKNKSFSLSMVRTKGRGK